MNCYIYIMIIYDDIMIIIYYYTDETSQMYK